MSQKTFQRLCIALTLAASVVLQAANLSDNFGSDTSASAWTVRAGAAWVHDAANGEADVVQSNPRWGLQYNTTTGATDHESQVTFIAGDSSSHGGVGGPAVRMRNDATKQWYYAALYPRDSIIQLLRRNDGTDSSGASSTQLGVDQAITVADGDWVTVRLAAEGTTIKAWWTVHGAVKPADPGWIGSDGSPNYSQTDATYNSSTYNWAGMAGNSSGNDYDTRHDFWKARAVSDRGGGGSATTPRLLLMGVGERMQ